MVLYAVLVSRYHGVEIGNIVTTPWTTGMYMCIGGTPWVTLKLPPG